MEAADNFGAIDRASWWYTFTRITLPLVSPILLIALIFRTMEAFKTFDIAYTSVLIRAQRTLDLVLAEMNLGSIPVVKDQALNERDYGDLSGLNKDDARKKWGEEQVHQWRRSYDVQPPGGESLKDTVARTLPYYVQEILPTVLGITQVNYVESSHSLAVVDAKLG